MHPAARARRMRKRNGNRLTAGVFDDAFGSDQLVQWQLGQKSLDCQATDGDQQRWSNDSQLALQPVGAARLLLASRHTIAASARVCPGITTCDSGDVDLLASRRFIDAGALEPAKKRSTRAARKWHASLRLDLARRLTNQH